jgi:hypothetical protein
MLSPSVENEWIRDLAQNNVLKDNDEINVNLDSLISSSYMLW